MQQIVKAVKALSSEVRIRILNVISERECCVCEVMHVLDISQTCASRNLTILYNTGFLKLRRQGQWVLYSIDQKGLKQYQMALLESVQQGLEGNTEAIQDRQRVRSTEKRGLACARKS